MPSLVDSSFGAIGELKESMLTEAQFQARHGLGWILSDGRNVAGSRYATITGTATVPDARGVYRRGKNNSRSDGSQDPAGERTLGAYQDDQMQGHRHARIQSSSGAGGSALVNQMTSTTGSGTLYTSNDDVMSPVTDGTNGTPRTGVETRVKNIAVNVFIRIN